MNQFKRVIDWLRRKDLTETKIVKEKAVADIKKGKMPDHVRNPNDF